MDQARPQELHAITCESKGAYIIYGRVWGIVVGKIDRRKKKILPPPPALANTREKITPHPRHCRKIRPPPKCFKNTPLMFLLCFRNSYNTHNVTSQKKIHRNNVLKKIHPLPHENGSRNFCPAPAINNECSLSHFWGKMKDPRIWTRPWFLTIHQSNKMMIKNSSFVESVMKGNRFAQKKSIEKQGTRCH